MLSIILCVYIYIYIYIYIESRHRTLASNDDVIFGIGVWFHSVGDEGETAACLRN